LRQQIAAIIVVAAPATRGALACSAEPERALIRYTARSVISAGPPGPHRLQPAEAASGGHFCARSGGVIAAVPRRAAPPRLHPCKLPGYTPRPLGRWPEPGALGGGLRGRWGRLPPVLRRSVRLTRRRSAPNEHK